MTRILPRRLLHAESTQRVGEARFWPLRPPRWRVRGGLWGVATGAATALVTWAAVSQYTQSQRASELAALAAELDERARRLAAQHDENLQLIGQLQREFDVLKRSGLAVEAFEREKTRLFGELDRVEARHDGLVERVWELEQRSGVSGV